MGSAGSKSDRDGVVNKWALVSCYAEVTQLYAHFIFEQLYIVVVPVKMVARKIIDSFSVLNLHSK